MSVETLIDKVAALVKEEVGDDTAFLMFLFNGDSVLMAGNVNPELAVGGVAHAMGEAGFLSKETVH